MVLCVPSGWADNQFEQIYDFVTELAQANTALAYWIEDTSGNYRHTVYVTNKVATQGMGEDRPSILPFWAGRRSDEWGTGYPTTDNPLPDTVTSATPSAGTFIRDWDVPSSLPPGDYYYYVEVNLPFDTNDYYTDWIKGQPSVVYKGSLKVDTESTGTAGIVVGHGDLTSANSTLFATTDNLTTALDIITSVSVNHYLAPSITTSSLADATAGSAYSETVSVTDPNASDTHTFSLLASPAWMSINNSGVLSGTPIGGDVGTGIQVTIRVEDGGGLADTLSTTLDVLAGSNSAPVISTSSLPDATEDQAYNATVSASDPDSDSITFSLLTGPSWLSISDAGALSGTPLNDDVGTDIVISIRAADPGGLADTLTTHIDVINMNDPPEITTVSLPDATEGEAYGSTVLAADPDGDSIVFSLLDGPAWLSITSGGVFSGTPASTDIGAEIPVSVRAADPGGFADTLTTAIDVLEGSNSAPVISTSSLPDAAEDQAYNATVSASDPDTDSITFSLLTGPSWLSISEAGVLSGTPLNDDVGTDIAVSIRAADPGGLADTLSTTFAVTNTNDVPEILTTTLPDGMQDMPYSATLEVLDPDANSVLTFSLLDGPAWMGINPATGELTGNPASADVGTGITVRVRVTDNEDISDETTFTISISDRNGPPEILTALLPDATEDAAYSVLIEASDPDAADTLMFSLLAAPEWLSIDSETGVLSGTPLNADVADTVEVSVVAADNRSPSLADTLTVIIAVINVNNAPEILTRAIVNGTEGAPYTFAIEAVDPDIGDTLTYVIVTGPEWMSLDAGTGILSGIPGVDDVADNLSVTVRVKDRVGLEDEAAYRFNIVDSTSESAQILVDDTGGQFDVTTVPGLGDIGLAALSVEIPAGALDAPADIRIEVPASVPEMGSAAQVVEFTVVDHEGRFDFIQPVVICIPYSDDIPNEELLTIKEWDPVSLEWHTIELALSVEVDTVQNIVIAQVTHFSIYGVVEDDTATDVAAEPVGIMLTSPYPNPCNNITTFQFQLPGEYDVKLSVYDILGREIAVLENGWFSQGLYSRSWDGRDSHDNTVSNGVYLYLFTAGDYTRNGKLLYLK